LSARTTTRKNLVVVLPLFPCTEGSVLRLKIAIFFPENNTHNPISADGKAVVE
jgi:hypothetical protein